MRARLCRRRARRAFLARAHVPRRATKNLLYFAAPYGTSIPDTPLSSLTIRRGCYFDVRLSLSLPLPFPVFQYSERHGFRNLERLRYAISGRDNESDSADFK